MSYCFQCHMHCFIKLRPQLRITAEFSASLLQRRKDGPLVTYIYYKLLLKRSDKIECLQSGFAKGSLRLVVVVLSVCQRLAEAVVGGAW